MQTMKLAFTLLSVSHCDCYSDLRIVRKILVDNAIEEDSRVEK